MQMSLRGNRTRLLTSVDKAISYKVKFSIDAKRTELEDEFNNEDDDGNRINILLAKESIEEVQELENIRYLSRQ